MFLLLIMQTGKKSIAGLLNAIAGQKTPGKTPGTAEDS